MLALQGDGDGEVEVCEQADRGPAVPGFPADDLPGVQAGVLLVELVILRDPPPGRCGGDQLGQRHRPGRPAPVIRTARRYNGAAAPAARCARPHAHREYRRWPTAASPSGNGGRPWSRTRCASGARRGRESAGSHGRGHGAARAGTDDVVSPDPQHVAHLALADAPAQLAAAVDLVAGHEGGADPQPVRAVQEIAGQLRLGGEQHLLRDPGQLAVLLISGAPFGQVQSPADQGVAAGCGEGQRDRHLAQRDPACGAAVLAGCASTIGRCCGRCGPRCPAASAIVQQL